jgi:hypothetical protein
MMAEEQLELKAVKARKPASKKPTRVTASREKSASGDGAEQLRCAADRRVGRISEKLADLLEKKALGGDVACAKALLALATSKKRDPKPVKKRKRPSLASRLAAEPAWPEEE